MRTFSTFATITSLLLFAACTKDIGPNPDLAPKQTSATDTITFTKHIKPIIDNNCIGCHNTGGQLPNLSTYNLLKTQVDGGRIKARVIDGPSFMPAPGRLPDTQIDLIKNWLDAGAPNN